MSGLFKSHTMKADFFNLKENPLDAVSRKIGFLKESVQNMQNAKPNAHTAQALELLGDCQHELLGLRDTHENAFKPGLK